MMNEAGARRKTLTEAVKAEARRLGFDLVGVTTPEPPPHFAFYENWLAQGRHGEMHYLATPRARQRRAGPRSILPGCRSILVLGVRYTPPEAGAPVDAAEGSGPRGRLAAYAWGQDYHDLLPERLKALADFIQEQAGAPVPNRWYTDTGPILERDLAQRAGLGWAGKNSLLIHPELGSYFFLAEILLGIDLEPDPPFTPDHCGSCRRCLEACPTGCILPDRSLDARRCISYLTIELKGPIPAELRPQLGEWVFGCDICQQVCPWNERFAAPVEQAALTPLPGLANPDLIEELSLTPDAFNRKFKGAPVKRTKRRGYLRNVAVALGNTAPGGPQAWAAAEALGKALRDDPEPLVRGHAAWALGRLGSETARQALQAALETEQEAEVLAEIRAALEAVGPGTPVQEASGEAA
jgi:epoxyqueuosine reductase